MHKDECKIFKDLDWFKTLDWGSYTEETVFGRPHCAQIITAMDAEQNEDYFFNQHAFPYTQAKCSGLTRFLLVENIWTAFSKLILISQLPCIVSGMKNTEHDNPDDLSSSERGQQESSNGWMYRVAARPGIWKVSQPSQKSTSAVDPARKVAGSPITKAKTPSLWSNARDDLGANHPDAARAKRREYYQSNKIFLLDAGKAPGLVKFLARPSIMDDAGWDRLPDGTWKKAVVFPFLGGTRDKFGVLLWM
ncbi:uncharacterized protein EV420DRAFT_1758095 [Desarmillaria tabescens]|uniref:Uncharacterized protein n=1 Tax=Armillaria tabescens TaxID=1929756 RepID=A0AA39NLI7_ARMTA|nr:uncharacterized protein EV420DRAFT_1758095 [Desarmillaria tabescens]KAK0467859.1 hypothetical protein EV420DRAFT_1758095 [Desarmillaria tabescens]